MAELAAAERQGPDPWDDRPELWPELSGVWAGWWQLAAGRGSGFSGPLPITSAEMGSELDETGVTDHEERRDRRRWWQALEAVYFEWLKGRQEERADGRRDAVPGDER